MSSTEFIYFKITNAVLKERCLCAYGPIINFVRKWVMQNIHKAQYNLSKESKINSWTSMNFLHTEALPQHYHETMHCILYLLWDGYDRQYINTLRYSPLFFFHSRCMFIINKTPLKNNNKNKNKYINKN